MERQEAIEIAVKNAKEQVPVYATGTFEPHNWVVDSILEASNKPKEVMKDSGKRHKHYDLIRKWIEDTTQIVQYKSQSCETKDTWYEDEELSWAEYYEYRFKPKMLAITGSDGKTRSYPEHCSTELKISEGYYIASIYSTVLYDNFLWSDSSSDIDWLKRGIIHLTKEAAILHAKAMLGID